MKKLSNFFDTAPLFQIFIFWWLFTVIFIFLLFQFFSDSAELPLNQFVNLKMGLFVGVPFGFMLTLTISMSRKSDKFWKYADEVEAIIHNAETKETLQSIFDNEFKTLQGLGQGKPHGSKLKELYAIVKTKYKYLK